uniref:Uncharacterized protein n=1 Tax=Vannella robusta TaxID=1487602 RepID=A0A7S4HKG6_9EUKA|mmetsp:Transcript_11922/g.14890  ORF Transcript_11922/g.14890 Transcript_11922/m.14890 type:complete len:130 (+) Transcript_11922:67-456(+)
MSTNEFSSAYKAAVDANSSKKFPEGLPRKDEYCIEVSSIIPGKSSSFYTPLGYSVLKGRKKLTQYLIDNKVNSEKGMSTGESPLQIACKKRGNTDLIKLLLSNGAIPHHLSQDYMHILKPKKEKKKKRG